MIAQFVRLSRYRTPQCPNAGRACLVKAIWIAVL